MLNRDNCLIDSFRNCSVKSAGNTALVSDTDIISYGDLNRLTDALALELQSRGAGPEKIVALAFNRSFELVISLLAILKSGAAYLPIDVNTPTERLEFIFDDANPVVLLTSNDLVSRFKGLSRNILIVEKDQIDVSHADKFVQPSISANSLAYVIYTSGSTGNPKGCLLQHGTLRNRIAWMQSRYLIDSNDAVLQKTPYTFDVSVWEFVWPLAVGARLVIAKPGGHADPDYLHQCVKTHMVTVCHFVPSMFRHFMNRLNTGKLSSLRYILFSGEALPYELMESGLNKLHGIQLHNLYGPTEATIDVTAWECQLRPDGVVPIGKAIDNVEILLLDDNLKPVSPDAQGEICIAGDALARGYLNRVELTAKAFVIVPDTGKRIYRTGDLGQWLADGELRYLGRKDNQVKLRGFRIELGEIESCLEKHENIVHAIVLLDEQNIEDPKLVAYCQTSGSEELVGMRKYALTKLPEYMVPNKFVAIEKIPVTSHGKADRGALKLALEGGIEAPRINTAQLISTQNDQLPDESILENSAIKSLSEEDKLNEKDRDESAEQSTKIPNDNDLLKELIEISCDVLNVASIEADNDFLDLGATSFTLLRLGQAIDAKYEVNIPVDVFLGNPSVIGLYDYLKREKSSPTDTSEIIEATNVIGANSDVVSLNSDAVERNTSESFSDTEALQGMLLEIVQEVLDVENIKYSDDFLELGATSFTLLRVGERVDSQFKVNIPVDVFLSNPSINGLVDYICTERNGSKIEGITSDSVSKINSLERENTVRSESSVDSSTAKIVNTQVIDSNVKADILGIAREILEEPELSLTDDFLEKGATSFTLLRLGQTVDAQYNVNIPVDVFLSSPSVQGIADFLGTQKIELENTDASTESNTDLSGDKQQTLSPAQDSDIKSDLNRTEGLNSSGQLKSHVISLPKYTFAGKRPSTFAKYVANSKLKISSIEKFFALLSANKVDNASRYLYASGGGKLPVQTYFYFSENGVDGINHGFYYFQPESHALVKLSDSLLGLSQSDIKTLSNAPVTMFLWAQIKTLQTTYLKVSSLLANLDACYLAQTLNDRKEETGISLSPVELTVVDEFCKPLRLDEGHRFAGCLQLGSNTETSSELLPRLFTDLSRSSYMEEGDTIQPLDAQEQKRYEEGSLHLRTDLIDEEKYDFNIPSLKVAALRARSSQRSYLRKPIELKQLSLFLSNVAIIYPLSELVGTSFYLYVANNGVAGLESGMYLYSAENHTLELLGSLSNKAFRQCFYPFNRAHYDQCGFVFFQIAKAVQITDQSKLDLAVTAAGRLGQSVLQQQADLQIGVCPIGWLNLNSIAESLELKDGDQFVHGFTCGAWQKSDQFPNEVLNLTAKEEQVDNNTASDAIAIIGIHGNFANISDNEQLWQTFVQGKSAYREIEKSRYSHWDNAKDMAVPVGGFLQGIDQFDHLHFGVAPIEARAMDPQERLLLEIVWKCIEDAGYTPESLQKDNKRVGVFIGAMWGDYQHVATKATLLKDEILPSAALSSLANSISHRFNFYGPSMAVDTGCASSLSALHLAEQSIKSDACDIALVGAVNLIAHPYHNHLLNRSDLLSKDGKCNVLSADADGWVLGEGVAAVLIRSSKSAYSNGDNVYAELLATCSAHRGKTRGRGMPAPEQQSLIIKKVIKQANLNAKDIQYVECAATGAGLADAAEWRTMQLVLSDSPESKWFAGTLKPNIGHLEASSGLSQLFKVLFQLQHKKYAPTIVQGERNPLITSTPSLQLVEVEQCWEKNDKPRRALINNYSAEGVCAHVIVQENTRIARLNDIQSPELVVLSAASIEQLATKAKKLLERLDTLSPARLCDVAYTLQTGRVSMPHRLVVIGTNYHQVASGLNKYLSTKKNDSYFVECEIGQDHKQCLKISENWLNNDEVDWHELHRGKRQRVSLPTHIFQKYSHWVLTSDENPLHPEEVQTSEPLSLDRLSGSSDSSASIQKSKRISVATHTSSTSKTKSDGTTETIVEKWLKEQYAAISGLEPNQIDANKTFDAIGLSSLLVVRLTEKLHQFGFKNLSESVWFELSTIHEVAVYLIENHYEVLKDVLGLEAIVSSELAQPVFDALSESSLEIISDSVESQTVNIQGKTTKESSAIIGMACLLPDANTPNQFWKNIASGKCSIAQVPESRSELLVAYKEKRGTSTTSYTDKAGLLKSVDYFDPLFFGISPAEATTIDPQERLFLETAWSAVEDAGIAPPSLKNYGKVGVFVGIMNSNFERKVAELDDFESGECQPQVTRYWSVANRVSYTLDLDGPSMAVDTACSSSLTALHLAIRSLREHECDYAIVGGSNLILHASNFVARSMLGMLSPTGNCQPFVESADGTVVGEGVVAFLLTRESLAKALQTEIKGLVLGSAINSGGKTNGYTVPNPKAQKKLIRSALLDAGVNSETISYVEAHGTGTSLGDTIEFDGLCEAIGSNKQSGSCSLGSVKSNIGHAESAAGAASLLKVLLQFKNKQIAPSLGSARRNSKLAWDSSPFTLQEELAPWSASSCGQDDDKFVRTAAISSFGAGGTNVHVIVQEADESTVSRETKKDYLFVLSASSADQLRTYAKNLHEHLLDNPGIDLSDLAYTLQIGRQSKSKRLSVVTSERDVLLGALSDYFEQNSNDIFVESDLVVSKLDSNFLDSTDISNLVDNWIADNQLNKVATLWLKGYSILWDSLYDSIPCRISLPTYPFLRQVIPLPNLGTKNSKSTVSNAKMHVFELDRSHAWFSQHCLNGVSVLPGVACFQLIKQAIQILIEENISSLSNVRWLAPIVNNDQISRIETCISSVNNEYEFAIHSPDKNEIGKASIQGKISQNQTVPFKQLPIKQIRSRCVNSISVDQFYKTTTSLGLEYGPLFQRLSHISIGDREALLTLKPSDLSDANITFTLDAALHGALAAFVSAQESLWLPTVAKTISLFNSTTLVEYVYASLNTLEDSKISLNLELCSSDGDILAELEGVEFSRLPKVQKIHNHESEIHIAIEYIESIGTRCLTQSNSSNSLESYWIIADDDIDYETISSVFTGKKFVILRKNDEYLAYPTGEIGLSFCQKTHVEQLCREQPQPDAVIRISSTDARIKDRVQIEEILQRNIYTWVSLVQSYKNTALANTSFVSIFVGSAEYSLSYADVALLKVASAEYPSLNTCAIQVSDLDKLLPNQIERVLTDKKIAFCRIKENEIFVSKYKLIDSSKRNSTQLAVDNVVVISGGLGKIGLALTKAILQGSKSRVALIGRRNINRQQIDALLGFKSPLVQYYAADIADTRSVENALAAIRLEQGPIEGVIHAAGISKDSFIVNKQSSDISEVLGVKIFGLHALDELTQSDNLRYFIAVSSLAATMGSRGQVDYAYANQAINQMIGVRRQATLAGERVGLSVSVALPFVVGGGMQASDSLLKQVNETTGVEPIPLDVVADVIGSSLNLPYSQYLVLPGRRNRIEKLVNSISSFESTEEASTVVDNPVKNNSETLRAEVVSYLVNSAAEILQVDTQLLTADSELSEFGFDSVLLTRWAAEISHDLSVDISPTQFFSTYTVDSMTEYLLNEHASELEKSLKINDDSDLVEVSAESYQSDMTVQTTATLGVTESAREMVNTPTTINHSQQNSNEVVAIVGIGVHLPDATSVGEFWEMLDSNTDVIRDIPDDRWDWRKVNALDETEISRVGGFVDKVDNFDASFFSISPLEAEQMDPQQRLLLQSTRHAIEDAGYSVESLKRSSTGVYVGASTHDYAECLLNSDAMFAHGSTGTGQAFLANRVSFVYDFCGPSQTIDTACSSSLVALSQACAALKQGVCDQAIVAGVNLMLTPTLNRIFSAAGMLSPSGRCRTFSKDADGYVRGEGVVVLMLKRLNVEDCNHENIYAIVKGASENHGGKANSLTAPNPNSQARVVQQALNQAGIDITSLDFIETHGTGTSLGDPVEIDGLRMVLKESAYQSKEKEIMLGALKTQFGHLEAAAGLAGVAKVALAMRHEKMPSNLHFIEENPLLKLGNTPFELLNTSRKWPVNAQEPRRAGISSFGIGGSNAHVILEDIQQKKLEGKAIPWIIPLSSKTENGLSSLIDQLGKAIIGLKDSQLGDISFTLCCGRDHFPYRRVFVVSSISELSSLISNNIKQEFSENHPVIPFPAITRLHSDNDIRNCLNAIAIEYVAGKSIDWINKELFTTCKRISLPVYVYTGKAFWAGSKIEPTLTQMLPELKLSTDARSASLDINYDHYLFTHHRVAGKAVLPGALWVCLIERFVKLLGVSQVRIENLRWHAPIFQKETANDGSTIELVVKAKKRGAGLDITVVGEGGRYVSAQAVSNISMGMNDKRRLELDLQKCEETIDLSVFQAKLLAYGLDYREGFRVIEHLAHSNETAIAKLKLAHVWSLDDTPFHPAFIDGAMQVTALLQNSVVTKNDLPHVPYAVDSIDFYPWVTTSEYIFALAEKHQYKEQIQYNVGLYNDQGTLLVKMNNIQSRVLTIAPDVSKRNGSDDVLMLKPYWSTANAEENSVRNTKNILLLERNGMLKQFLAQRLQESTFYSVSLQGDSFQNSAPDYQLDISDENAFANMFDHYLVKNKWPDVIVHYWSVDEFSLNAGRMSEQLNHGVKSLMRLVQYICSTNPSDPTHILYLYPMISNPLYSAVAAFANTVNAEQNKVTISVVGIDDDYSVIEYEILHMNIGEYYWRNGERQQRLFEVFNDGEHT